MRGSDLSFWPVLRMRWNTEMFIGTFELRCVCAIKAQKLAEKLVPPARFEHAAYGLGNP